MQLTLNLDASAVREIFQEINLSTKGNHGGDVQDTAAIHAKLDQLLARTQQIMASQQDFQARIDQINQNTSASAQAAQAIAANLQALKTQLDQVLTDAGVPAAQEQQILDQLSAAADTSGQLKTFLEQTASSTGGNQPEPQPVPVPEPAPNATTRR